MKVDFNNLRKQAMLSYNRLCRKLNSAITDEGDIVVPADEIQSIMDSLRMQISSICACYKEDDPECKDVLQEIELIEDFNEPSN